MHTRYLLLEGGGTEPCNHGKPNTMSPRFSLKRRGDKKGLYFPIFSPNLRISLGCLPKFERQKRAIKSLR